MEKTFIHFYRFKENNYISIHRARGAGFISAQSHYRCLHIDAVTSFHFMLKSQCVHIPVQLLDLMFSRNSPFFFLFRVHHYYSLIIVVQLYWRREDDKENIKFQQHSCEKKKNLVL